MTLRSLMRSISRQRSSVYGSFRPAQSAPQFTSQSPPTGTVGVAYSYQYVAAGAVSFALGTGSLPAGLSLSAGGLLSGTPSTGAVYSYTVNATNTGGTTASDAQSVTIASAGGFTVTADFSVSRTSVIAPGPIFVNARILTSTNITQANALAKGGIFRQLRYSWNFGDATLGNHTQTGLPRNTQVGGPLAAVVYPTATDGAPATKVITLVVEAGHPWRTNTAASPTAYTVDDLSTQGGNTYLCAINHTPGTFATDLAAGKWTLFQTGIIQSAPVTKNVTVTSGNDSFTGTNTIYVSPSANYTLAPAGATTRTTIPALASSKRILLRNGEAGYGDFDMNNLTDCHVIGTGAGAKAACARVTFSGTRNVVSGISTTLGLAGMNGIDNMQYNNTVAHTDLHATTVAWGANFTDVYTNCVRAFIVGNTIVANATSDASMYGGGRNTVVLDNAVGDSVQHTYRSFGQYESYVAHNKFNGPVIDSSKVAFKQHALGLVQWPTTSSGGAYASEFGVQADNLMGHSGSTNFWTADNAPENTDATTVEGVSDMIYERNIHTRGTGTTTDFLFCGRRITMRGNSVASGTLAISNLKDTGGPVGINNSTYRSQWLDDGFLS